MHYIAFIKQFDTHSIVLVKMQHTLNSISE